MANHILLAILVEIAVEFRRIELKKLPNEAAQVRGSVDRSRQNLHAVARGQDHAFFDAGLLRQAFAGVGQPRVGEREALAYLHRRALVIDADELKIHEDTNL